MPGRPKVCEGFIESRLLVYIPKCSMQVSPANAGRMVSDYPEGFPLDPVLRLLEPFRCVTDHSLAPVRVVCDWRARRPRLYNSNLDNNKKTRFVVAASSSRTNYPKGCLGDPPLPSG